ncbi:MAG TPA: cupredoxin domain-containing protein [Dehalococcoidia bacterium]|nr:cupredoxin domain-containing protein [Dehalococcoidia bacterium]
MKRSFLLPALLLIASVALAACGGGGQDAANEAAVATPSASLSIRAKSLKFDKKALVAPPNTTVTLHFENADGGVLHNVAIYQDKSVKQKIATTKTFAGIASEDISFTSPEAGDYYFRCDVHPDMNGVFATRAP